MTADERNLKILLVPNTIFFPPYLEDLRLMEDLGEVPRSWVHDINGDVDVLDQRLQTNPPPWRRRLYAHLPMWFVQVLEVHRAGRNYDVVFLWSVVNVSLILALLLTVTRRKIALVVLFTRISEPKKAGLLKLVHRRFARIVLPPASQREFANVRLRIPEDKLVDLPWTTDIEFWQDSVRGGKSMICAAGGEMRDYPILVEALKGLDIPCHIAGVLDTAKPDWWNVSEDERQKEAHAPANVTFGTMSALKLRELYASSRFVVVPLRETNSDNGITCMNESWSMGVPVIVSRVDGQRGAFRDGKEGIWVPQGDVQALRSAIVELWNDPDKAVAMGVAGRRLAEQHKSHSLFTEGLNRLFLDVARQKQPSVSDPPEADAVRCS